MWLRFSPLLKRQGPCRQGAGAAIHLQEKGKAMEKKTIFGLAGSLLMMLTGCQSSDPGPGSRLMSRQSTDAFAKPSMNSMASTMPGNKSLGITDTNSRPGMMPGTNSVQQAGAMQTTT